MNEDSDWSRSTPKSNNLHHSNANPIPPCIHTAASMLSGLAFQIPFRMVPCWVSFSFSFKTQPGGLSTEQSCKVWGGVCKSTHARDHRSTPVPSQQRAAFTGDLWYPCQRAAMRGRSFRSNHSYSWWSILQSSYLAPLPRSSHAHYAPTLLASMLAYFS